MDNNNQEQSGFSYIYSAKEQAEIKRIRDKYTAPTEIEDKMALLRKLDAGVTNTAHTVALIVGVIGTLTLGFGMSLIMTDLSEIIGMSGEVAMLVGIVVGVIGGVIASLAYPVFNGILKAKRKEIAPRIISLTDELMK